MEGWKETAQIPDFQHNAVCSQSSLKVALPVLIIPSNNPYNYSCGLDTEGKRNETEQECFCTSGSVPWNGSVGGAKREGQTCRRDSLRFCFLAEEHGCASGEVLKEQEATISTS